VYLNPAGGTAAITVTYGGTGGPGFLPAPGGSGTSNEVDEQVVPVPPAPTITFNGQSTVNGQPVADNTNPIAVFVGQQIALAALPLSGTPQTNQYWDPPQGSTVASYTIDSATPPQSATVVSLPGSGNCQTLQGGCLTFYWIATGNSGQVNEQVTYHYSLNGQSQTPVIVTFQVNSPTNVNIDAAQQPTSIQPGPEIFTSIDFNGAATSPLANAGQYSWVQVINSQQIKYLTSNQGTHRDARCRRSSPGSSDPLRRPLTSRIHIPQEA
jgi:hypothetical protein